MCFTDSYSPLKICFGPLLKKGAQITLRWVLGQECERSIHTGGFALPSSSIMQLRRLLAWGGCVTCGTGVMAALYGCMIRIQSMQVQAQAKKAEGAKLQATI